MPSERKLISYALAMLVGSVGYAQTAAASEHCPATTAEDNIDIVERYIQATIDRDMEVVKDLLHEDLSHNLSRSGIEYGEVSPEELANRTPKDLTIHQVFGDGDRVAIRYSVPVTSEAVQQAAKDQTGELNAIAITRIECGKIREVWIEQDVLGMLLGMGMSMRHDQ
jgi:predicted ester cyclase